MAPPTNAAWHSRDILPILRFAEAWDGGSTSETYGPETLPDRRSVGIESETTQTGIDWCAPRVTPCLREARSRGGANPTKFRPLPSRARLAGNDTLQIAARRTSVQRDNFRDAFSHWRRSHASIDHAAGPRQLECSYGCGQHDKRNRAAAFQLSPRQRKHNLPGQLRVHPRSDRNGIAWSNRGRQSRWHRPY
jgi:hypothetical protein